MSLSKIHSKACSPFSAAILELSASLPAAELGRRLTERSVEIFGSRAAVLALKNAGSWEIAAIAGASQCRNQLVRDRLAEILGEQAALASGEMRSKGCAEVLGAGLAATLGWREVLLVKLTGSDGILVGLLALADLNHELSHHESQLLSVLARHVSLALENGRLFSRIEQSRKHWAQDFDAISDLIVVHNSSNRVIRVNRAFAEVLGIDAAGAVGRTVGSLKLFGPGAVGGSCPLCRDEKSIDEGFAYQTAERTYLVSTSRVDGTDDPEPRIIHVLKDVTERREADRKYRRERDFNKNILNNTQSMILVLDTAGLISYANRRCSDAGYGEDKLLGRPLVELVPAACRHVVAQALSKTLEGTAIENLETPLLRGKGTGHFQISLSPMRDEQGEINSVVVVMSDITDAATLQAKLMHTEKMAALGQLVSGVAHEVNNPLAAIVGFTDLLLENQAVPQEAKEDLQVILQEAQRTRVIVQNLLSFARQMPEQREPVQINAVLRQTLKLRAYDFSNHDVELFESYDEDLPLIIGDPNQMQQVFLNIVNNAYDAIQEGSKPRQIRIMTSHDTEQLEISFWNSGPISNPERIFDPFFTTKEVGKGTGLGLSICYGIIRAHGGEIAARNEPDGNGCEFIVRLPVATVKAASFPSSNITRRDDPQRQL